MPRDYQPNSGSSLIFKSTSELAYHKEQDTSALDINSFYITTMPKTIKELLPSNIYLNYLNMCGMVWISSDITEEQMNERGFVKINVDKNYLHNKGYDIPAESEENENLQYLENITHNKFVVQLDAKNKYFSLYVPVNNRFIGKYDELSNNCIIEIMSRNNYVSGMKFKVTGTTLPDDEEQTETVVFTANNYELYSDTTLIQSGAELIIQSGLSPIKLIDLPNGNYTIEAVDVPQDYYAVETVEFLFENGLMYVDDTVLGINKITMQYDPILSSLVTDRLYVDLDASDLTATSTTWTNRVSQSNTVFTFGGINDTSITNAENTTPKLPIITGTSFVPNTSLASTNVELLNNNTVYVYFSIYLTKLSDIIKYTGTNYNLSGLASHIEIGVENSTDYLKPMYTVINDNVVSNFDYSTRLFRYNNLDISMSMSQIADTSKILLTLTVGSDNNDRGICIYNTGEAESVDETYSIYDIELDYTFDSVTGDIIFTDPEPINIFMFNRILDNIKTYDIYVDNELVFTSDINFNLTNTDTKVDLFYNLQNYTGYNLQTFGAAYIHSVKMYNKTLSRREIEQNIRYEQRISRTFTISNEPEYITLVDKDWTLGALDNIYSENQKLHIYEYFNISRYVGTSTRLAIKLLHSENKSFVQYKMKCYCYDKYCNLLTDLTYALHYNELKNTMELVIVPSTFNQSAKYIRFGFELINDENNGTLSTPIPDFSMLYIYNANVNSEDNEIFFDDRVQLPVLYNPFDDAGSYGDNVIYAASMLDTSNFDYPNNYTITYYIGNKIIVNENHRYQYSSTTPSVMEYKNEIANIISNRVSGLTRDYESEANAYTFVVDLEQFYKYHNTINAFKLDRGNHLLDSDCLGCRYQVFFFDNSGNYLHNDTYSITYGGWYDENDYLPLPYDKTNIKYAVFYENIYIKNMNLFSSRYSDMVNCASTLWSSLYDYNNGVYTLKPLPNNMTASDVEFLVEDSAEYNGKYAYLINCFERNVVRFFAV